MNDIKPILFNTDMVRAILEDRKTVTRRVVKPRYSDSVFEMFKGKLCEAIPDKPPRDNGDGTTTRFVRAYAPCEPPYRLGDILYVREAWQKNPYGIGWPYFYKASPEEFDHAPDKWRPSIHMPREAARIFLRVTDVRVERLLDITEEQARAEGIISYWAPPHDDVAFMGEREVHFTRKEAFSELWDSTVKPADRALYGRDANPWVWVIEFERVSREKAEA